MSDKGKVYLLYDELQRREAALYVGGRLREVVAEIEGIKRDMRLVRAAQGALDEILRLLSRMREIAVEAAGNEDCDRAALGAEPERLKGRIDRVAAGEFARWSGEESARLRKMVAVVESLRNR